MKECEGCSKLIPAGGFCPECLAGLPSICPADHSGIDTALFVYQGQIRDLILRAKVKNQWSALQSLCSLFVCNPLVLSMVADSDVIVPAASSLWGRMRGRFDVAQSVALELSRQVGVPLELLPTSHYLRGKKRAGQNDKETANGSIVSANQGFLDQRRVLMIDDIVTTGWTMRALRRDLLTYGAKEVKGIALARSPEAA